MSRRSRRTLLGLALVLLLWALALEITGGVAIETRWGLVSSRAVVRPFVAGLALLAVYAAAARRSWREDLGPLGRASAWPPVLGAASTAVALVVGIGWGTRVAAGPDQSGYVSEAEVFARGELTVPAPPWSLDVPWNDAAYTASPVGWQPSRDTRFLAPTYSPGLPMLLAPVLKTFGRGAVFYVVPALGALLVAATYLLGARLAGPWAGAIASALVVSSPTFLLMQQQVMSDIPTAAFWTVAVASAARGRYPLLAGAAAGLAILTRPNLVPLLAVPAILLAMPRTDRLRCAIAFGIPIGLACAAVAVLNWRYYGSPLVSGYGPLAAYYSFDHIRPNVGRYGRWMLDLHTPLVLLAPLGPLAAASERGRVALVTLAIPVALLAIYLPFLVFDERDWGYTRFFLAGYPAWFAGLAVAFTATVERTGRRGAAVAAALVTAAIAVHGWRVAVTTGVFTQRQGDARYARAVEYANQLPSPSILMANAHSGTLRLYTGRDVLRFEAIRPAELDVVVEHLTGKGYSLFLIGDEFEIEQFRTMFAGSRTAGALGTVPRKDLAGVVVYDIRP